MDFVKSEQMLKKAQELYMIEGRGERGLISLKNFVKTQLEKVQDLSESRQDKAVMQRIRNLYKSLYNQVFANEDNYLFNQDLIDDYMNFIVNESEYFEAIEAKNKYIQYKRKSNEVDHMVRRAYLEMCLLHIIGDDKFGLKKACTEFHSNVPGAFNQDEYKVAVKIKDAILPEEGGDQDWDKVRDILKQPIFGFLNNEVVKRCKLYVMQKQEEASEVKNAGGVEEE